MSADATPGPDAGGESPSRAALFDELAARHERVSDLIEGADVRDEFSR